METLFPGSAEASSTSRYGYIMGGGLLMYLGIKRGHG
jgi:hypothetical protein